jgi:hypothetical protein
LSAHASSHVVLAVVLLVAPAAVARSEAAPRQDVDRPSAPAQRGSISGRVAFDDGAPASTAVVTLRAVGDTQLTNRAQLPADDGMFVFDGLGPGLYHVEAVAPGYVLSTSGNAYSRPGDSVSITLESREPSRGWTASPSRR